MLYNLNKKHLRDPKVRTFDADGLNQEQRLPQDSRSCENDV